MKRPDTKPRATPARGIRADSALVLALCTWFAAAARSLPWRAIDPKLGRRNAYLSLVSELMLQQTQVSRVLEKFSPFVARFPTIQALAAANLDHVLNEWSGLGYYRRARHLHGAAKSVVKDFAGEVPQTIQELRLLPGVGRYTAGAVASMVYSKPEPLVDGNVARVLLRVRGKQLPAPDGMAWSWEEANRLVGVAENLANARAPLSGPTQTVTVGPGPFNEALMELGALICTPANPRCDACPLAGVCEARRLGLQDQIPHPKERGVRTAVTHSAILVRDPRGRLLMEKRSERGLWAGMWQPPTLETRGRRPGHARLASWLGVTRLRRAGQFVHHTTHREVEFAVWDAGVVEALPATPGRRWVTPAQAQKLAMGNPHKRLIAWPD